MIHSLFQRFRVVALLALVALLLLVGGAMLAGIQRYSASATWVAHTHEVLGEIEAVRSSLRAAESAARGYRLTGSPVLRAEYAEQRALPADHAGTLARLVSDNPRQRAQALELRRREQSRLAELDLVVALYDAGHENQAINMTRAGRGQKLMRDVNATADELEAEERRLLIERRIQADRDATLLSAIVAGGMLLSLAMLAALLTTLWRENRRSQALEREARGAMVDLESSLVQREALAEQRRLLGAFAGLLHSCHTIDEALDVSANALARLVPQGAAVCYTMRASQNLLETRALFGTHGDEYGDAMRPDQCWGLRRSHTHLYDPAHPTALCEHLRSLDRDGATGACVPLTAQGATLGLLHVSSRTGEVLTVMELAGIESVAEHLAVVLHSLELRESLRVQSLRDPLTGLYNRRYLEESLPREMERCERRGRPLSVLMLDIDHFKRFNDEHGHGAGDALLTRVGQVLAALTRGEDIACRYGGEEFTVVMPEASLAQAEARAEDIREAIGSATITYMRRELGPVTASIGVCELAPGDDNPESIMAAADRALYEAKAQGRDRVVRGRDRAVG